MINAYTNDYAYAYISIYTYIYSYALINDLTNDYKYVIYRFYMSKNKLNTMIKRNTPEKKEEIAKILRGYRLKNNLAQEELANKLGASVFSISRWERGKHYPTPTVIKLMKILGVMKEE